MRGSCCMAPGSSCRSSCSPKPAFVEAAAGADCGGPAGVVAPVDSPPVTREVRLRLARRAGPQVADDLVAETFLAAFAKRDRYDLGHADARPWLYGIATNLVGQHRRDEARQYRIRQAAAAEPAVPGHAERVAA